jgi:hypothetical protein
MLISSLITDQREDDTMSAMMIDFTHFLKDLLHSATTYMDGYIVQIAQTAGNSRWISLLESRFDQL